MAIIQEPHQRGGFKGQVQLFLASSVVIAGMLLQLAEDIGYPSQSSTPPPPPLTPLSLEFPPTFFGISNARVLLAVLLYFFYHV